MFTAREVAAVLGVTPSRLRSYLRSGFVAPLRDQDGALRFSFQDLVLLRKAEGLVTARIPAHRVNSVLRRLRDKLPEGASLTGMQLASDGREIVVDDGQVRWAADSGQVIFDFARPEREAGAPVTPLVQPRAPGVPANDADAPLSAQELYDRACATEETSPAEARELYRRALKRDSSFADAHVNLGRLLHEAGELHAALVHYREAQRVRPNDATAAFNVGVALEDLGMANDAITAYQQAVENDPTSADAHYNLARLLEQTGKPEIAIRHLLMYRKLTKRR